MHCSCNLPVWFSWQLGLCALVFSSFTKAATFAQINGTAPDQGFVGAFVGPGYTKGNAFTGNARNFCNLLISTGFGTPIYLNQAQKSPNDPACTDLANYPVAGYFLEGTEVKCTGPGEGYIFNYPANVTGSPATGYYCQLFTIASNLTSFSTTFNQGSAADVPCPEEMADASDPTSDRRTTGGFIKYHALNADC